MERRQAWVHSLIAIVELMWVLEACFQLTRAQLVQALDALLHTKELVVDRADQVMKALRVFNAGMRLIQ